MFSKKHWTDKYKELVQATQDYADEGQYKKAVQCVWDAINVVPRNIPTANDYITQAACGVIVGYKSDTFGGFAYIAVKMAETGIGSDDEMLDILALAERYALAADPRTHRSNFPMCQTWSRIARSVEARGTSADWMRFINEKKEEWCRKPI